MLVKLTERERDSVVVALNYWRVSVNRGDWGATLDHAHGSGRQAPADYADDRSTHGAARAR